MIILFGPAGAGKTVQGHMLAARMGWRWLSAGQILRETGDKDMLARMAEGKLVDNDEMNRIMGEALKSAQDVPQVILDGWPRALEQAHWLIEQETDSHHKVDLVFVLEVPRDELLKRMAIRGRADDTPDAIDERLAIFRKEVYPILNYYTEQNIPIVHMDGTGSVGQIHDKIVQELVSRSLA